LYYKQIIATKTGVRLDGGLIALETKSRGLEINLPDEDMIYLLRKLRTSLNRPFIGVATIFFDPSVWRWSSVISEQTTLYDPRHLPVREFETGFNQGPFVR
jgi:hypothetical protein